MVLVRSKDVSFDVMPGEVVGIIGRIVRGEKQSLFSYYRVYRSYTQKKPKTLSDTSLGDTTEVMITTLPLLKKASSTKKVDEHVHRICMKRSGSQHGELHEQRNYFG